jgi:hypothetical protein
MSKIPESEWKWFGYPGHFICAYKCRFHLATQIGKHLISTVGDMRERNSDKPQEIGYKRLYETMVFLAGEICSIPDCNCGLPSLGGGEIICRGYNTAGEANMGHLEICNEYADQ